MYTKIFKYTFIYLILGLIIVFLISELSNKVAYREQIGKEYIVGQDTLTITNFSTLRGVFILENNKEIDASLILNQ